jgi:hypothetical protein
MRTSSGWRPGNQRQRLGARRAPQPAKAVRIAETPGRLKWNRCRQTIAVDQSVPGFALAPFPHRGTGCHKSPPCSTICCRFYTAMELNGAFSNPFASDKPLLTRVCELHRRLLDVAAEHPRQARFALPKASPVLETVTLVLELAGLPMRARDVHAAAEQLTGGTLLWSSVKAALAAGASADRPRFRRVSHGVYEVRQITGPPVDRRGDVRGFS